MQELIDQLRDWLAREAGPSIEVVLSWLAALGWSRETWLLAAVEVLTIVGAAWLLRRSRKRAVRAARARPAASVELRAPAGYQRAVATAIREPSSAVWGHMLAGLAVVVALAGGVGGWAANSDLAGAVIAQGTVVVDSNVKKVQHPSGGIVGEIRVKEGDVVKAGDLLLRLDETQTKANLQIVSKLLTELAVRQLRLLAERDGWPANRLVSALEDRFRSHALDDDGASLREMLEGELQVFEARAHARAGQRSQLKERIAQLREEISGVTAQRAAKSKESELIKRELGNIEVLEAKQLVTINRVTQLRREEARIEGERGQLQAAMAQARGRIAEIELQILQIDSDLRSEVTKDLREIQAKEAELSERRVAAEDLLTRIDIRAPQSGTVHQLAVFTVGGVINAGEPIMLIVPEGDKLVVDAKVAPQDIDQVRAEQAAFIRFPAFNSRTTPEIAASVQRVAADLTREPQSASAYFSVRLDIRAGEMERHGALRLVPGMPAEIHIRTGDRTALSYLVKPFTDQLARAFRER